MRRTVLACTIVLLFLLQSWSTVQSELITSVDNQTFRKDNLFNQTGFVENGVYTNSTGEVKVNRPHINWLTPNDGPIMTRTGACSVSIESIGQVWMMGGWNDPDPQQQNDEGPTDFIEIMKNENKTWEPLGVNLPHPQQYCEAELVGNLVVVVGEWFRSSNPPQPPTGRVQIYNLDNNTWYNGTSMPSNNERGLGAMAEADGYLYYAGGVRNSNANDATNRTYRYNPQNDTWTRMADMNEPRASFELVNYHGQLYAMGGFQGTQTWNRQALDYVERYDPATNTWTNLSSLPVAMFGWTGTVLHDEIVLVGGFNNGPKSTVYHWNPLEDTWSKGNDIGYIGHYDTVVEEINGSIIWATGEMSGYAYSNWNRLLSQDSEYQNKTNLHEAWINSPIIDLRPNANSVASPVQLTLQGQNSQGGQLSFQYRHSSTFSGISSNLWSGPDGTINTTFPIGTVGINSTNNSNFIQYRIKFSITDLDNWDEPDLDSMSIRAEHASFVSILPTFLHPRTETVLIQTSHDSLQAGEMYLEVASCDSFGAILGSWSRLSHDGISFSENDGQNLFFDSNGVINSTTLGQTVIDWSIDWGDLAGISHLCFKVGTNGEVTTEFVHSSPVEIDNHLEFMITDLDQFNSGDTVTGGIPIKVGVNHSFPSSGMTLSSGNLQARIHFEVQINDPENNSATGWLNQTTPWQNMNVGERDEISWTLPTDISGIVNINLEARSDQPFQITSDSNNSNLVLDNENPVIIDSYPENQDYIDSKENRELSILLADTSGFITDQVSMEVWVQSLDDGSDGSLPDGTPQENEYREINFTLENLGSYWWFNATQSDDSNDDQELVYMRILGIDNAGFSPANDTIWWKTRDARTAIVDRIINQNSNNYWEVSRDISWEIFVTDGNALSDITSMKIEFGGDSEFGIKYDVADSLCTSLGILVDMDKTTCSHRIVDDEIILTVSIYTTWYVDLSMLDEGMVEISVTDIDGTSESTFQNLWVFSDDFDFSIIDITDITGPVTGEISNESVAKINDQLQIRATITHSLSGTPYEGQLSLYHLGDLQGENWQGLYPISVENGVINATINLPSTGGLIDFSISFMDPRQTRTISTHEVPVFKVDANEPVILDSTLADLSRYHLNDVGIGVNIDEEVSWSNELELTCQILSTEVDWEPMSISLMPASFFQGKTQFSFEFDFSARGDPTLLSLEARMDCWADGMDDAGWDLVKFSNSNKEVPWLSVPLSSVGPNIELVDVSLDGIIETGKEIRAEISVKNTGEDLDDSFNISAYIIENGDRELVGKYSQSKIQSGQGITKRISFTVPEGDWELLVIVDEEQNIWELNEEDNTYSKKYQAQDEINSMIYIGGAIGIVSLLIAVLLLRRRKPSEVSEAKKMPDISELKRSGPAKIAKSPNPTNKPRRGPPPKPKPAQEIQPVTDISAAMAKLSLDTLPGKQETKAQTVGSYESLPPGGDYEYLSDGTFYGGVGIGRWKLEQDGSFTKIE